MNIKQSVVLFISLLFSLSAMATSKWLGKWFEVEVIIVSQLDDKAKLKEVFTQPHKVINEANAIDLLTAYLNPNIATLKQQLPICDELPDSIEEFSARTIGPLFHQIQTLEEIVLTPALSDSSSIVHDVTKIKTDISAVAVNSNNLSEEDEKAFAEEANIQTTAENETNISLPINESDIALVKAAEQEFSDIRFSYQDQNIALPSSLCAITQEKFNQLALNHEQYTYHGFSIDKMPNLIDQIENLYSETPYLLSKESLQLTNIVKQLRRSKNFRPLLHLGWRQPVFNKGETTAIKLYAGDNLLTQFNKNIAVYNEAIFNKTLEEDVFRDSNNNTNVAQSVSLPENARSALDINTQIMSDESKVADKIRQLIQQVENINTVENVLEQLNTPSMDVNSIEDNIIDELKAPGRPIQPWYLQGLFKVFLIGNHLNIDANFNILNLTLAEQESIKLQPDRKLSVNSINFKQNRRMFSQEIHYFDHPYMGILVQIRRHKRPEPELEISEEHIETVFDEVNQPDQMNE